MFVKNRAIRLFVSSTFQDMHEERDALCRFVFPYLEDFCAKRNIGFIGVDLRWGVTEEEARQGKTIGLCLSEIDNCRPYFLGILGHRYGWIPPRELTAAHTALFQNGASITEAEMLYGVLHTPPDRHTNAFFCLRSLPLTQEIAGDVEESGESGRLLENLKKKIRESGHPVLDDYTSIESFCTYITEQVCHAIEADFPAHEAWDEYKSEAIAHTYYARMQNDVFTGRNKEIGYIDHYVKTNANIPLFITGASGTGKTALLAKWAIRHEELSPDDFVFMHFYGASIYSGQWESVVKRLIYELCQRCRIEFSLPDTSGELAASLSAYLHFASQKGVRIMLVLDGVDLINTEETYGLAWLPKELPTGVQLILSVKTESGRKNLLGRGYKEYRIALLTPAEQESMISAHLTPYAKKLDTAHIARILQNKAARNPLYLKILLHELCIAATHDRMDRLLTYYLDARNVAELFIKVIQAYEKTYNINGIDLTRHVLSFICETKHGLTENELLAVLQLPQAAFSPLYLALKPYLLNKNGILNFAYGGLRDAVKSYYPLTIPEQKAIRMRLAENFRKNPATFHAIEELPWLLAKAASWNKLYEVLCDTDTCLALWKHKPSEVKMYWHKLETKTKKTRTHAYGKLLDRPQLAPLQTILELATFFMETGYLKEAERLLSYLRKTRDPQKNRDILQRTYGLLGNLYHTTGKYDESTVCYQKKAAICKQKGNLLELSRALGNLGLLECTAGKPEAALDYYEKAGQACRKLGFLHGIQTELGNRGNVYATLGKHEQAAALFKEQEQLCRESGNLPGLVAALGNQGVLALMQKEYALAYTLFCKQEKECKKIGDLNQLQLIYGNQAVALRESEEYEKALKLLEYKRILCDKANNFSGMQTALYNLSQIHLEMGNAEKALPFCKERTVLCRKHKAVQLYTDSLYQYAVVLQACGRAEEAEENLQQVLVLSQQFQLKDLYIASKKLIVNKEE